MSAEDLRGALNGAAAPPAADWRVGVARLATLPPVEADREMVAIAAAMGCKVTTLREEVRRARGARQGSAAPAAGRPLDLPEHEPWPGPVDGAALLDGLAAALELHVVMPEAARDATALWVVFTHALDRFEHAPRLRIRSPEKRCGKSTLLDLLLETVAPAAGQQLHPLGPLPRRRADPPDAADRRGGQLHARRRGAAGAGQQRAPALARLRPP